MKFREIPQFISDGSYQVNVSWEYMMEWLDRLINEEGLQLNPDFIAIFIMVCAANY